MYAWENSFANLVKRVREKEIELIQKNFNIMAFNFTAFMVFLRLGLALVIMVWVLQQNIARNSCAGRIFGMGLGVNRGHYCQLNTVSCPPLWAGCVNTKLY